MESRPLCSMTTAYLAANPDYEEKREKKYQEYKDQCIRDIEQAIRMLHGSCPHNRPDSAAPRTASNCIQCMAEAVYEKLGLEYEFRYL